MDNKEYRLFYPVNGADLRLQWPELARFDEFKKLSSKELLVVWYYACQSSPLRDPVSGIDDDRQRMAQSILRASYKDGDGKSDPFDLKALKFTKAMNDAIYKMASFQADLRMSAMRIIAKTIDKGEQVSDMDIDEHKVDATKLKAFMSTQLEVAKQIADLVKIGESNFGLAVFDKESDGADDGGHDFDILQTIQEKTIA